ncbi:hypothetical protein HC729_17235 [Vibrio sp. S12_S33]|nr:hypothetical protein [Vibrio sp. S12_S33]
MDDPHRNYKDTYAKPEIVMALSPFKIMVGFRALEEITVNLNAIESESLNMIIKGDSFGYHNLTYHC